MSDQDWRIRIDTAFPPGADLAADRRQRLTDELVETLGAPTLVIGADGTTRPTWTLEAPQDFLEELCRVHNARRGWVLVESEGGETD
jgi:hypothetical protein